MTGKKTPAERAREYRKKNRDKINAQRRERYRQDAEFRERQLETRAEYRHRVGNDRQRERYHNDPDYRARIDAAQKRYRIKKQREKRGMPDMDES